MSGPDKDTTTAAQGRRRKARAKPRAAKGKSESRPDLRERRISRIRWDELTPEEQRNIERLKQADERWRQQHAEAYKRDAVAVRELDRALARQMWGPPPKKQRSKRQRPQKKQGQQKAKKVSAAALRRCVLAIVAEHAEQYPGRPSLDEVALHKAVENRLGVPVPRDRVRDARDEHAPDFRLPVGRPRKYAR
jgi:hypothetical protein